MSALKPRKDQRQPASATNQGFGKKKNGVPITRGKTPSVAPPSKPSGEVTSFVSRDKQMGMIEARILSRKGLYEESLNMYRDLRQRYPDDEQIWEDYIETLENHSDYELALAEINALLRTNPSNLGAQRIQARIYQEVGRYRWTFPVYENVLRLQGDDPKIWSDYAYARQDAGEWAAALNYFSRVLELDPENREVLRSIHGILREHRPRFLAGYRVHNQQWDDSRVDTLSLRYMRHLTQRTEIDLGYDNVKIERPAQTDISPVDRTVNDFTVRLRHVFSRDWQGRLGGGLYSGLGGGRSFLLGIDSRVWDTAHVRGEVALRRPWYDPVDAANRDGRFDRATLSFDLNFDRAWGLYLALGQWDYFAQREYGAGADEYGRKRAFTGILVRRISQRPDSYLGYSYHRTRFRFEDENFTVIPMIESEGIHTLYSSLEHWPCTYWAYALSGGLRRDCIRAINSWYALCTFKIKLGNRIECAVSYEYSSEARTVLGGQAQAFNIRIKTIL